MLYGQRVQQNERETKLKKSQLYREMLDNQIRINQQYRQPKSQTNTFKHSQIHTSFKHMPIIQRKGQEQLQTSFIHEIEKQQPNRSHFLPVLKDSNKFMKGVSRFVKVQELVKPKSKPIHVYTEMIEEQDNFQYEQVCQKIIRDLKDIKNKPKARNRRRLYDNSELKPHKKNRLYTETHLQGDDRQNNEQFSGTKNHNSLKYPLMISSNQNMKNKPTELKIENNEPNQFQTFNLKEESQIKLNELKLEKSIPQTEVSNNRKDQLASNLNRRANSKLSSYSPSTQIQNQKIQPIEKSDQVKKQKITANKVKINRERNNNNSVSYNQTDSQLKNEAKLLSSNASRLELQRQNFLQVLRKVKNRGESLYLKLNRYPKEKMNKNQ